MMPLHNFYNVFHQNPFNWMIVLSFFLSGIGGGVFLVTASLQFVGGEKTKDLRKTCSLFIPAFIAIAMFVLLIDLGRPFRFYQMMINFNPSSAASWGGLLMNLLLFASLGYAFFLRKEDDAKSNLFAMIGMPLALGVTLYSGFILLQMPGRALWHSPLIPVLFSVSAIISGLALVILVAIKNKNEEGVKVLSPFLVAFIAIDILLVLVESIMLFNGNQEAIEAGRLLFAGAYAPLFLVLYLILGLIVPLVVFNIKKLPQIGLLVASILILVGVFAMRYAVVMVGQHVPLS